MFCLRHKALFGVLDNFVKDDTLERKDDLFLYKKNEKILNR